MRPKEYGDALRACRKKAGKTLQRQADEFGVSLVHYQQIEKGQRSPGGALRVLIRMATGLDLDQDLVEQDTQANETSTRRGRATRKAAA